MRALLLRSLVASALVTAAACIWPTDVCGCTPPPKPSLVVTGTVTDTLGVPVAGAHVGFDGVPMTMSSEPPFRGWPLAVTDADGRFATRALATSDTGEYAVRALVVRAGSTDTVRRRLGPATFRREWTGLDTLHVTLPIP